MRYELVIIWSTGEKEIHEYTDELEALVIKHGYEQAFGSQIEWSGIRERR